MIKSNKKRMEKFLIRKSRTEKQKNRKRAEQKRNAKNIHLQKEDLRKKSIELGEQAIGNGNYKLKIREEYL